MDRDLESVQEARDLVERAYEASQAFAAFSQAAVDAIVAAMAAAATAAADRLGRLAVEETGYGKPEDKREKNLFAAERVYQAIRGMRTRGILAEDAAAGIIEIGTPVGVVAAVLPCTNPTSTAIYKALIAVKAGNAIVVSPHPAAVRCICESVRLLRDAARGAGAPNGLIACLTRPSLAGTQELMRHRRTGVILATGGMSIVRAAYSSGKPALGVGPGNVPAFIDRSADVACAVADVLRGKSFDWGTICSSEQAIVAEEALRGEVMGQLRAQGAHLLNGEEAARLGAALIRQDSFTVNPQCVGQSPQRLGEIAGFPVPGGARVLVAELAGLGKEYPLSAEKLSPVLALYFVPDREAAMVRCTQLLHFGGMGHTCVIHAREQSVIREYGLRMPAYRVVVNCPAPQGSIGAVTNLFPAMTLGCGAAGGNSTSDNIGPQHLMNIKRVAYARPVAQAGAAAAAEASADAASPWPSATAVGQPSSPEPAVNRPAALPAVVVAAPRMPVATAPVGAPATAPATAIVERFLSGRRPVAATVAASASPQPPPAAVPAPATAAPPPAAVPAPAAA
ncbi:MAG: aldehyde dehydrogenase family protein, partial [Terriglobales bacterium]